jgi:hypothetical protein
LQAALIGIIVCPPRAMIWQVLRMALPQNETAECTNSIQCSALAIATRSALRWRF